jgi:hypothetical protein
MHALQNNQRLSDILLTLPDKLSHIKLEFSGAMKSRERKKGSEEQQVQ